MRLRKAPIGIGFDASTYVDPTAAAQFVAAGYEFVVRYIRRDQHVNLEPASGWPVSLSTRELEQLLDAGLCVSLVQFARFHGKNYLGARHGAQMGHNAAWNARNLGAPEGTTIWYDAEWTDNPSDRAIMDELRAWAKAVSDGGYRAGVYVGYDGLSGAQWYSLPYVRAYWRSAIKTVRNPQPRGWSMYQGLEHCKAKAHRGRPPVFGQAIDTDFAVYDDKGARPYMISP